MNDSPTLTIKLSAAELDKFCDKLIKRSRDITKTHDAMVTLESFIQLFSRDSHGSDAYRAIETTIKEKTDSTREQLLKKNTENLIRALKQCDVGTLTAVHTPLSRNGFYQILQTAIGALTDDEIRLLMVWSENWTREARKLAEEASNYPDAMDFNKAGISVEEYHAMCDIDRVLNPQS